MHTITTFIPRWRYGISSTSEASFIEGSSIVSYDISRVGVQGIERFSGSVRLSSRELAVYEHFIDEYLYSGTSWFRGRYATSSGESVGVMRIVNGDYSLSYLGSDYWEITHQIEVWKDAIFA